MLKTPKLFNKSLSESFVKSKRLDAEYYQDKYDSFEKAIRNYHNGYSTLNNFSRTFQINVLKFTRIFICRNRRYKRRNRRRFL